MNLHSLDEARLWKLIVKGNDDAFAFVYRKYSWDLYKYGHKFTIDSNLIEDVIQDTFVKIFEQRQHLQIRRSIKFYLFSTFRHEIIKRVNHAYQVDSLSDFHDKIAWEESFERMLEDQQILTESKTKLTKALEALPPRQKEAIFLRYIEALTNEEIAELMGIKIPYLYNLISSGLKTLKSTLSTL
ncbi:RNA polymerase sigma factor [Pleomorphovibrio marinus]|uniref:RNA polymerase sigma factor n=1 Tax=Pleomorphovibrio marinus TaxID=2164132 RepID=UPI000E09F898|nr:sigma-70 family RNA polymerase sigma factor [Pleomorphovibrio marinus]